MLKRLRAPSPVPSLDPLHAIEPSLDVYERVVKRRRQFAPPGVHKHGGSSAGAEVSEDDDEDNLKAAEGFSEYAHGKSKWQEEAGLYKAANTLLHDLHAEYRHRAIFSTSSLSPHHSGTFSDSYAVRAQCATRYEGGLAPHSAATRTTSVSAHDPHSRHGSSVEGPASWNGGPIATDAEVQIVTQRYEDTNRFLGSLFLSRKRQLDVCDSQSAS